MNELESFIVLYGGKFVRVYKENEVDTVIAELKDKLRHHKYKRCLAMAKTCEYRWMNLEKMIDTKYRTKKMHLCERWQRIWLKLAEKFKEVDK